MSSEFLRHRKIKSVSDFNKILKERRNVFSTKFFNLYFVQSQVQDSKLGIIVSKKSLRRAVDRNKIKRVTREIFRRKLKEGLFVMIILVLFERFSMKNKEEFSKTLEKSLNFLHNIKIL